MLVKIVNFASDNKVTFCNRFQVDDDMSFYVLVNMRNYIWELILEFADAEEAL